MSIIAAISGFDMIAGSIPERRRPNGNNVPADVPSITTTTTVVVVVVAIVVVTLLFLTRSVG